MLHFTLCYQRQCFRKTADAASPEFLTLWPPHICALLQRLQLNIPYSEINQGAFEQQGTEKDKQKKKQQSHVKYVGKLYLAWTDFVRFQGKSLMDGHLLWKIKYRPEAPLRFLFFMPVHISENEKPLLIIFDLFFNLSEFFFFFFDGNSSVFLFHEWKPSFDTIKQTCGHVLCSFHCVSS